MSALHFDFRLWRVFHVAKVAAVLARCDFQGPLKDVAHRVDVPEAAFACDHFHAVVTFFQPPASCFDAQALDKFCGRGLHFFGEDAREIARTHRYAFCQQRHGERFLQVIEHPCLQVRAMVFDRSVAVITRR